MQHEKVSSCLLARVGRCVPPLLFTVYSLHKCWLLVALGKRTQHMPVCNKRGSRRCRNVRWPRKRSYWFCQLLLYTNMVLGLFLCTAACAPWAISRLQQSYCLKYYYWNITRNLTFLIFLRTSRWKRGTLFSGLNFVNSLRYEHFDYIL